ncbi:uncharacterized protein LOC119797002 [Cyprinodon tularosa]|uniref:uncharacterized protein LOC119797002 n=1 Tax=Cyprinodon tularosa TaxID=77115 RepID=UPI0018E243EB|nr:uncharacterized protein LOC119797002 [Cyprinodon tularosa]
MRKSHANRDELYLTLQGVDISKVNGAYSNTMGHMEISYWQALIKESIHLVDSEIAYVEQMKEMIEHCIHERTVYSQHMGHCVALYLGSASLNHDQVFVQLKKEESLAFKNREVMKKQAVVILNKLSSLRTIRYRLKKDFQDKLEALKVTTRCITFEMTTQCSGLTAGPLKPTHVSYEQWLSRCQHMKMMADKLVRDSTNCREKLQLLLLNIKLEIAELTKDVQRLDSNIKSFEVKLHYTYHLLNIYNQRPGLELCLDQPHACLIRERRELTKMINGVKSELKRSQQNLDKAHQRLTFVEDKLARNAQLIEVAQRCRNIHQSFRQAVNSAVVLSNKPSLQAVEDSSCP